MSERNSTICKLCQKVLAYDEARNHHCEAWCGDNVKEEKLKDNKPRE